MDSQASPLTLGLLPESRTRWGRFVFSYGVQSLVLAFFVIVAIAYPEVLVLPVHDYHFVSLVSTPPPIPQAPAPGSIQAFPSPLSKNSGAGDAAARSHAGSRRIGPEEEASRSGGAGAQGNAGRQERILARHEADDSEAAGQDECVLHGKLGNANDGSGAGESTNGWLRRSERRAGIGYPWPSGYDRAGGLV